MVNVIKNTKKENDSVGLISNCVLYFSRKTESIFCLSAFLSSLPSSWGDGRPLIEQGVAALQHSLRQVTDSGSEVKAKQPATARVRCDRDVYLRGKHQQDGEHSGHLEPQPEGESASLYWRTFLSQSINAMTPFLLRASELTIDNVVGLYIGRWHSGNKIMGPVCFSSSQQNRSRFILDKFKCERKIGFT